MSKEANKTQRALSLALGALQPESYLAEWYVEQEIIPAAIKALEEALAKQELLFEVDGEMLTASQVAGVALFDFQEATGCNTAEEFKAKQEHDCTRSHPHEEMSKECELRTEIARLTNQLANTKQEQGEQDTLAYREAASLAQWLFNKHFAREEHYASGRVVWGLCDTTAGVISQIDNMVCKLVREQEQGSTTCDKPVAVKHMMKWVDYLKRKSDYGQHMQIPSGMSAGACWDLAIELEQFINTTPPSMKCEGPQQRKPLTADEVFVPLEILEAAEGSLGAFCSDHGWSDQDMQNMDNLSAYIAQHKAAHGIKE